MSIKTKDSESVISFSQSSVNFANKMVPTTYECRKCESKIELYPKDNIVCKNCGERILFKQRTNKIIEKICR